MPTRLLYMTALAAMITCLPGCSLLISRSGTALRDLDSRQIVHDRFGPPDSVSLVDLIDPRSEEIRQFEVEHYHIHAKLDTARPTGFWPPALLLIEPLLICGALYEAAREYVEGHHLAFVYDEQGNTTGHQYPQPFFKAVQAGARESNVLHWKRSSISGSR
jgi:hypothetical protein